MINVCVCVCKHNFQIHINHKEQTLINPKVEIIAYVSALKKLQQTYNLRLFTIYYAYLHARNFMYNLYMNKFVYLQ